MKKIISRMACPIGMLVLFLSCFFYIPVITEFQAYFPLWISISSILLFVFLYWFSAKFAYTIAGELSKGAMIGINAWLNGWLISLIFGQIWLSVLISGLIGLASFLGISRSHIYHTSLGWINWLLPMSWPVILPGLLMFVINLFFAPLAYIHPLIGGLKIKVHVDLSTCTLTMYGGLIRPIRGFSGLNMGNFIFINPGWEHLLRHEIGHLFSLAALGSVFHYTGGIDECYLQKNYWEAYAEYLAESYNSPGEGSLSMWK